MKRAGLTGLLAAALALAGCPARHFEGHYRPAEAPTEAWSALTKDGGSPRIGLVPFFDTRWLAQSSGYRDGATVVGTIGGRPIQLVRGGEVVLVADFVHESLLADLHRAGADVVDLRGLSTRQMVNTPDLVRLTREERLDYLILGDLVAFDYAYVDRGPGSLWGADVAYGLTVLAVRSGRILLRELVDDAWRGDPTGAGESESDIFDEGLIDRWLIGEAQRVANARALSRIVAVIAHDRTEMKAAAAAGEPGPAPKEPQAAPEAVRHAEPDPFAPRAPSRRGGNDEGSSDWVVIDADGTLEITSDPKGATVTLGDRVIGATPLALAGLHPGQRIDLLVQHPGHRPYLETVQMPAGRGLRVDPRLAPLAGR
ncbi:MAG: PEGA domain-containing protein [Myxococcales bacterium]|nr:PEGA domain-containing protein [Myxococcales bacterium]